MRATPLLLIVLYDGKAALCGARGEQRSVFTDLNADVVERICRTALDEAARSFYQTFDFIPSPTDPMHHFVQLKDVRRIVSG